MTTHPNVTTRKALLALALSLATMLGVGAALAQDMGETSTVRVTLTNTSPQVISPPLLIAHDADYAPFLIGGEATPELARLAEDGDASELAVIARLDPSVAAVVIADGPLPPGQSVTLAVETSEEQPFLTVLGMLVTTNDAFLVWTGDARELDQMSMTMADDAMTADGATSMDASSAMGGMDAMDAMGAAPPPHDAVVRVFDAGSEANTERCDQIPGPPCGSAGARALEGAEGHVALHGGILGVGDLDPAEWDWRNPVLEVAAGG